MKEYIYIILITSTLFFSCDYFLSIGLTTSLVNNSSFNVDTTQRLIISPKLQIETYPKKVCQAPFALTINDTTREKIIEMIQMKYGEQLKQIDVPTEMTFTFIIDSLDIKQAIEHQDTVRDIQLVTLYDTHVPLGLVSDLIQFFETQTYTYQSMDTSRYINSVDELQITPWVSINTQEDWKELHNVLQYNYPKTKDSNPIYCTYSYNISFMIEENTLNNGLSYRLFLLYK